jgi:hypothetical protein
LFRHLAISVSVITGLSLQRCSTWACWRASSSRLFGLAFLVGLVGQTIDFLALAFLVGLALLVGDFALLELPVLLGGLQLLFLFRRQLGLRRRCGRRSRHCAGRRRAACGRTRAGTAARGEFDRDVGAGRRLVAVGLFACRRSGFRSRCRRRAATALGSFADTGEADQ